MPLDPDESGYIDYIGVQYIIFGCMDGFNKEIIDGVWIYPTESHPSTGINEEHFVIETSLIRLKWTIS